jgi:hypothetical protein
VKKRFVELKYFPADFAAPVLQLGFYIPDASRLKDLRPLVADALGLAPGTCYLFAEVIHSEIKQILKDTTYLSELKRKETFGLNAYELPQSSLAIE